MPAKFKTNLIDVDAVAKTIKTRLDNVYFQFDQAQQGLAAPDYGKVHQLPGVCLQFLSEAAKLSAAGVTYSAIAPTVAAKFAFPDAVNLETEYEALKVACQAASDWIIANGAIFTHSLNTSGSRVYNIEIDTAKKTELTTHINAVLDFFE